LHIDFEELDSYGWTGYISYWNLIHMGEQATYAAGTWFLWVDRLHILLLSTSCVVGQEDNTQLAKCMHNTHRELRCSELDIGITLYGYPIGGQSHWRHLHIKCLFISVLSSRQINSLVWECQVQPEPCQFSNGNEGIDTLKRKWYHWQQVQSRTHAKPLCLSAALVTYNSMPLWNMQ
jgi:hypothetical protein